MSREVVPAHSLEEAKKVKVTKEPALQGQSPEHVIRTQEQEAPGPFNEGRVTQALACAQRHLCARHWSDLILSVGTGEISAQQAVSDGARRQSQGV